jgi:hypothetical protein
VLVAATTSLTGDAKAVAWVCFGLGIVLVVVGVVIGLYLSFTKTKKDVEKKVEEAAQHIDNAKQAALTGSSFEGVNQAAAGQASQESEAAKGALEEISSIIGSLPEHLRFAGLLILVGVVLMSVATVQFGGHSIF